MSPHYEAPGLTLHLGDCVEVMAAMPAESVDAIVCDPPYGLSGEPDTAEVLRHWLAGDDYTHRGGGFMGKTWDTFVPGPSVWRECLRVLKPGGHLLAFGGTRTYDLQTVAIRLAGFEIRDSIGNGRQGGDANTEAHPGPLAWIYGSGFPPSKSLDVSKAIDRAAGAEREVVGFDPSRQRDGSGHNVTKFQAATRESSRIDYERKAQITAPATPEAARWQGWGTALKPAWEPVVVARKPLGGTVAANVLAHGTGALNVDGCRVEGDVPQVTQGAEDRIYGGGRGLRSEPTVSNPHPAGRWPANVVMDEAWIPIVRPRATLELDAWNLLADWCRARNRDVPNVRGAARRPAEQGEADEVLRAGVLVGVAEPAQPWRGASDVRSSPLCGVDREDARVAEGTPAEGSGQSELAGLVHLQGLPDDLAARGTGDPGAPAGDGAGHRPQAALDRGGASPERDQDGQPSRELGDPGARDASDDPRRGDARVAATAGRGRSPHRRTVEVLLSHVPAEWRDRFEFTGDVARVGAAARLDAEVGERPSPKPYTRSVGRVEAPFGGGMIVDGDAGANYGDTGGPSRFFYTAKASTAERDGATHPTVKPIALMRWLVRLVTPPGGVVLDPFSGSGTTLIAAREEGFAAIGIEREPEYAQMIVERWARRYQPAEAKWEDRRDDDQLSLLGGEAA